MISCITLAPFREVVVHAFKMREHRAFLTFNLLPQPLRFQALRPRPDQLASKPRTPSNRCAVSLSMPASVPKAKRVQAVFSTAAPSRLRKPMERIAGSSAVRANHSRPDPALASAHRRHGPLAQNDLDLDPARLD